MPGTMPADLAERLSDRRDDSLIDDYMDEARENIIERLVQGKSVHQINAADIFECALNDERQYGDVIFLLAGILGLSGKSGDDLLLDAHDLTERAREIIECYVDSKPEWIEERAAELAAEEP